MAIRKPSDIAGLLILARTFQALTLAGSDLATWTDQHAAGGVEVLTPGTPAPFTPADFAEFFGPDWVHFWSTYEADTPALEFTDTVGGYHLNEKLGSGPDVAPTEQTQNGHVYPLFLDGVNRGLTRAGSPDFETLDDLADWTVIFAIKTFDGQAYGGIVVKGSAFYFEFSFSSGSLSLVIGAGSGADIQCTTPVDDDLWHRVIITCVGGTMRAYIDGNLEGTDTGGTINGTVVNPLQIGVQPSGNTVCRAHILFAGIATKGVPALDIGVLDGLIDDYIGAAAPAPTVTEAADEVIDSGGGGRTQRLTGTGFVATPTIDVEGDAATNVAFVSSTALTCTMPAKTLPKVPRFAGTMTANTGVMPSVVFGGTGSGSMGILFRAKERAAKSGTVYANGNLCSDLVNATFTLGYTNKGVHASVVENGVGYRDLQVDCNILDGEYHFIQTKWDGVNFYLRVDNGEWKSTACGALSWAAEGVLQFGVTYGGTARHRGEIALVLAGPPAISDVNFDNILANIHRVYGIDLGIAKGTYDWTTLALELLFEPGNFNVGTGDWTGTASAGGSGSVTATSNVTLETPISRCFNITVTNPDTQAATLASAVRYWDPRCMFGVDDRGCYVDSRKGLALTGADVDSLTDQMNGNVFTGGLGGKPKPTIDALAFGGHTDAILTDEVAPSVGQEATALIGTSKTLPNAGRMLVYLAVVKTTSQDAATDFYAGNAPNTIIGDNSGSIEATFGLEGSELCFKAYRGGWLTNKYGNGLTDGVARLLALAADYKDQAAAVGSRPDARGFSGSVELGYAEMGYDAFTTYNTLFGSYASGTGDTAGDAFKGHFGMAVMLDLPCPVNEGELETCEQWAAQSFGAVSGLDFDPRFTGPTQLHLPNGYDATTRVWKAAVGDDLTAASPGPADAGDGTPSFNFATDWQLLSATNTAADFERWAGLKRACHTIARVTTTGVSSWGNNPFTDLAGSIHFANHTVVKDQNSWRGITLYKDGAGGFFAYCWDFDPVLAAGDCVQINVATEGLVDGSGVGDFIIEMKKVYDSTSAAWELWGRVTSSTPGAAPKPWRPGSHNNVLGDTGGGGGYQIGPCTGNIKAVASYRRDLSNWTAKKMVAFFQKITAPDAINPTKQPDCEAWWDGRSVTGTVGSGTSVINNQSQAHPETNRNLTEAAGTASMAAEAGYNNEQAITLPGDAFFDTTLFSSIVEQPLRFFWVANWDGTGSLYLFDCTAADPQSTTRVALLDGGTDDLVFYAGVSLTTVADAVPALDLPHVGCLVANGANSAIYVNDPKVPVLTGDAGNLDLLSVRLGARHNAIAHLVGKFAALGAFKGLGDYYERKRMFDTLKTRFGL